MPLQLHMLNSVERDGLIIVNSEWVRIVKEEIVPCFKVLNQNSLLMLRKTTKFTIRITARVAGI